MEEASALDAEAEEGALLAELDDDCLALGVGLDDGVGAEGSVAALQGAGTAAEPYTLPSHRASGAATPRALVGTLLGAAARGGRRAAARRSTACCRRRPSTARARWWRRCAPIGATGLLVT